MLKVLRKWFSVGPRVQWGNSAPKPRVSGITTDLLRELQEMPPGNIMCFEDAQGNHFAIMHEDDLEHVAGLAGLRTKRKPDNG